MRSLHLLFGTESGNAEDLAKRTASALKKLGFEVELTDMADFEPSELENVRTLLIITSTFGNGDPPYNAEAIHSFLMNDAAKLDLRFCVLGLGDTTYEHFAQCGKDFDRRLEELGGKRFAPRVDCDVDFEEPYEEWMAAMVPALSALPFDDVALVAVPPPKPSQSALGTRKNPLMAEVIENYDLHGGGSAKHTHHLALSVGGVGYELGDSFGIWPENPPALVSQVLEHTGLDPEAVVEVGVHSLPLKEALRARLEIAHIDVRLLEHLGAELGIAADAAARQAYIKGHHVLDALIAAPSRKSKWSPAELVSCLRPMAPRLYSVASSQKAFPNVVHFMVAILKYNLGESERQGIFSAQTVERCEVGRKLPVYVHPSPSFRLTDSDRPMIMIGPGTGLAPFRSFLQERQATGAKGKNWLFFGSHHQKSDFFYQKELEAFQEIGLLTHLHTAFSRDQADKVYVQHRMRENAAELFRWIHEGAAVYVCGDAKRMAPDVHSTLLSIIKTEGSMSDVGAQEFLAKMGTERLYQRDVY